MIAFKALLQMEAIAVFNHYRGLGLRITEVEEFKHSYLLTCLTKEGHRLQYSEDKKVINKIAEKGIFLSDISIEEMELIALHCPCKGSIFEIKRESDKIHITLCDDDSIYNTTITVDELAGYSQLSDTLTYEEWNEAISETIEKEYNSEKEELFYTIKDLEIFLTTKLIPTFGELITIRNNRIKKYSQLQADLEAIKKAITILKFIDFAYDEFYSQGVKMLDFFDINVVQGADKDSIVIVITSNGIRVSVGEVVARSINSTSLEDIVFFLHELQEDIENDFDKFQTPIANDFLIDIIKGNS